MPRDEEAVFCLKISYEIGSKDPGRVFRGMASLIASFTSLDRVLERPAGVSVAPVLLLEDIETGSLKTWLRNRLEEVPDEAIGNLDWKKIVGSYLVRGKRRLMQVLSETPEIESREDIRRIQDAVQEVAEETGITRLPIFTPPDPERLLRAASDVTEALSELQPSDRATYLSDEGEVEIRGASGATRERIESLLTREIVSSMQEMLLKVKKPDYLGISMWEFRHGDHPIAARIVDLNWLRRFQTRQIDVRPGDSLRAIVQTEVRYGYKSEVVAVHHLVLDVMDTVKDDTAEQLLLAPPDPSGT